MHGKGSKRELLPYVLDRFPEDDRSTVSFPNELADFFFEIKE